MPTTIVLGLALGILAAVSGLTAGAMAGDGPTPIPSPSAVAADSIQADVADVVVTPRGSDLEAAFRDLHRAGGPLVVTLVGQNPTARWKQEYNLVPWDMRFKQVSGRALVAAVAAAQNMRISWMRGGRCVLLYAGATDAAVEQVGKDLGSTDADVRRVGAWRGGYLSDPRVIPLLVHAVIDSDPDVAWQAQHSLRLLGWSAAMVLDAASVPLFAHDISNHWSVSHSTKFGAWHHVDSPQWNAVAAMVEVSGDRRMTILEPMFASVDARIRRNALGMLADMDGERAQAFRTRMFADPDATLRIEAAIESCHLGNEQALGVLATALTDLAGKERQSLRSALMEAGVERIRDLLSDASVEANDAAPAADVDHATRADRIMALLDKDAVLGTDISVRMAIAYALRWKGKRILEIVDRALIDPNPVKRTMAVFDVVRQMSGERALIRLTTALTDTDSYVRRYAVMALGTIGGERALDLAKRSLSDPDATVREQAVAVSSDLGGEPMLESLNRTAIDPELVVRKASAFALGRLGGERAMDLVDRLLSDPEATVRSNAVLALGQIGGARAHERLAKLLVDPSAELRKGAVRAEAWMAGEDDVPLVAQALVDADVEVRSAAVDSLGQIGGDRAVGALMPMLADPSPKVRTNAIRALGATGAPQSMASIMNAVADRDRQIRCAVADALGSIGGSGARSLLSERLAIEMEPEVLHHLSWSLNRLSPHDPVLEQLIAAAECRVAPKQKSAPQPEPVKKGTDDF